MTERHITESLEEAGFSEAQIEALLHVFAIHPHTHNIDEIIGLEEHLEELGEDCDSDEPEEDE